MFKSWSGGALVTEAYYSFFAEVWKRFNDAIRHENSPWGAKLARWADHFRDGTTPPRANGEAKLIHPWRVQRCQQRIARTLVQEWYGDGAVIHLDTAPKRAAVRLHRALLGSLVECFDYVPWAAHSMRQFCSMHEHRATKRLRADVEPTKVARRICGAEAELSPSLAIRVEEST